MSVKWERRKDEWHATVNWHKIVISVSQTVGGRPTCRSITIDGEYLTTRTLLSQAKRRAVEACSTKGN